MEETNGKMTSGKKKWGTLILMAVMFGLIAGGIMYDVNAVGQQDQAEGAGTGMIVGKNDSELLIATNKGVRSRILTVIFS